MKMRIWYWGILGQFYITHDGRGVIKTCSVSYTSPSCDRRYRCVHVVRSSGWGVFIAEVGRLYVKNWVSYSHVVKVLQAITFLHLTIFYFTLFYLTIYSVTRYQLSVHKSMIGNFWAFLCSEVCIDFIGNFSPLVNQTRLFVELTSLGALWTSRPTTTQFILTFENYIYIKVLELFYDQLRAAIYCWPIGLLDTRNGRFNKTFIMFWGESPAVLEN